MTPAGGDRGRRDGGLALVWVLSLTLLVLLPLGGVSLDLWRMFAAHRSLAAAADNAAQAAANGIDVEQARNGVIVLDPVRAESIANEVLAASPPRGATMGPVVVAVSPTRVVVRMSGSVRTSLLRLVGVGSLDVSVSAVGEPR